MANRTFDQDNYNLIKRRVDLFCAVDVGVEGAVTLQKWNYPTFGTGVNSRTYTAAATAAGLPSGAAYPRQYQSGSEGILSVVRTATGLWTVTLQDSYQRLVGLTGYASLAGGLSAVISVHENTTITNMTGTPSIIGVALLSSTGTAADPAADTTFNLHFVLADSTTP